jgi:hypothetical protein
MILRQLSANQPFWAASAPLLAGVILLPSASKGLPQLTTHRYPVDFFIEQWSAFPWLIGGMAVLLITIGALLANMVFNRNEFHSSPSYVPVFLYTIVASGFSLVQLNMALLLGNIFLLLATFYLLDIFRQSRVLDEYFRGGFWLGCAALAFPPYLSLFVGLTVSIFFIRAFNLHEWLVSAIAFVSPFLYWLAWKYWFDEWNFLHLFYKELSLNSQQWHTLFLQRELWFIVGTVIVFLLALPRFLFLSDRSSNKARSIRSTFLILSISVLASALIGKSASGSWMPEVCIVPVTFVAGYWFTNYRFSLIAPFIFYGWLALFALLSGQFYHLF